MESLYEIICNLPNIYARFVKVKNQKSKYCGNTDSLTFDLKAKNIYSGDYCILKQGKLVLDKIVLSDGQVFEVSGLPLIVQKEEFIKEIEQLYSTFYNSVPSMSESKRKQHFICKDVNKMGIEEIETGMSRTQARYALEAYIMLSVLSGQVQWENPKQFYWYSKNQKGLILLKDWFL